MQSRAELAQARLRILAVERLSELLRRLRHILRERLTRLHHPSLRSALSRNLKIPKWAVAPPRRRRGGNRSSSAPSRVCAARIRPPRSEASNETFTYFSRRKSLLVDAVAQACFELVEEGAFLVRAALGR